MSNLAVCTIVSKNYLPYARVLTESFLEFNKGDVYVLLVDKIDGYFEPKDERFKLIEIEELRYLIPEFDRFCFQYTILELNTAAKPYLLEHLLVKYKMKKLVYLDPDIMVTGRLGPLSRLLNKNSMVLTPHLTEPIEDDYHPNEVDILLSGTYNLGFFAMANNETVLKHVRWWQKRLHSRCIVAYEKGIFVDQKWMDLVPGFYDDVYILREPGYNIAYWNYHCRDVAAGDDGYTVNGEPAYFFHFSGFNPDKMQPVSKHQNRYTLNMLSGMEPLFELYRERVLKCGWNDMKSWPYVFDCFDNGVKIPSFLRRAYLDMGDKSNRFGNPFITKGANTFFNWLNEPVKNGVPEITRALDLLYKSRHDLQSAFPDMFGTSKLPFISWVLVNRKECGLTDGFLGQTVPFDDAKFGFQLKLRLMRYIKAASSLAGKLLFPLCRRNKRAMLFFDRLNRLLLSGGNRLISRGTLKPAEAVYLRLRPEDFGINVAGYITSESGVGAAVRADIRAIKEAGIPFSMTNLISPSRQKDTTFTDFTDDNPYGFNLIHVNADAVATFQNTNSTEYFLNRYNIGFWYWELSTFPDIWSDSFKCFNEVWVASDFCLDSISRVSPVPVVKIPPSVVVNEIKDVDRAYFDLNEKSFIFFFMFDFLSFFERKNPLAIVRAFKLAFGSDSGALLVVKCSNSNSNKRARDQFLKEAEGLNIKFVDKYFDKDELNALISLSDCYVSLHRSEGFGLPIAEAMYMGKPVIATGYSGNMEFMNVNNSFPVKYSLVKIDDDYGPYKKGNVWAEPDVEHAAELMRSVYEDTGLVKRVGQRAANDIRTGLSPEVTGKLIKSRLSEISAEKRLFNMGRLNR